MQAQAAMQARATSPAQATLRMRATLRAALRASVRMRVWPKTCAVASRARAKRRAPVGGTADAVGEKIERTAARLVAVVNEIGDEFGLRSANKCISITPVSLGAGRARSAEELMPLARAIDEAAASVGVDFIGGY